MNFIVSLLQNRPRWLYESSPYIYIVVGIWVAWRLDSAAAYLSAFMLIVAGCHVLLMRWNYRRKKTVERDDEGLFMSLTWQKAFECEHDIIDKEHRNLFIAGQTLIEAAMDQGADTLNPMITDLIKMLEAHFRSEEAILEKTNPILARSHADEHHALLAKVNSVHQRYRHGKAKRAEIVGFLVKEAIVGHSKQEHSRLNEAFWD